MIASPVFATCDRGGGGWGNADDNVSLKLGSNSARGDVCPRYHVLSCDGTGVPIIHPKNPTAYINQDLDNRYNAWDPGQSLAVAECQ